MIQLREGFWAIEVPEDARNIGIAKGRIISYQATGGEVIDLPPGPWQIVCTSKEVTEDQAKGIVEEIRLRGNIRYQDYTREFMWQETAIESLRSLLTSKGCDLNKNWLILKKQ